MCQCNPCIRSIYCHKCDPRGKSFEKKDMSVKIEIPDDVFKILKVGVLRALDDPMTSAAVRAGDLAVKSEMIVDGVRVKMVVGEEKALR